MGKSKTSALILIMGPSGVGKSTIIKHLIEKDPNIISIPIYSDRKPRSSGNFGRTLVSPDVFSQMIENGEFLVWHKIYGNRYAIPKRMVLDALASGKIPIQDYPEEIVNDIRSKVPTHAIYVVPPSLEVLKQRLDLDERNHDGKRFEAGKEEIGRLKKLEFKNDNIDYVVINHDIEKTVEEVLKVIHSAINTP